MMSYASFVVLLLTQTNRLTACAFFQYKVVCLEIFTWEANEMKQQGFTALTALNPQSKVRDFSQGGKNLKSKLGALQCLLDRQKHTHQQPCTIWDISSSVVAISKALMILVLMCGLFDLHWFTFETTDMSAHSKIASPLLICCCWFKQVTQST